ncbi:MAG: sigma-70 family RNA polymerase sigma factor [Wenzhouxiangella sp.]|nr:sigma-70 family RNA polymerase sigma factor [Wenzhouxiangella sp.]
MIGLVCLSHAPNQVSCCNGSSRIPVMNDVARQRRFDALVRRYSEDLFRFAVWLCGNHALAKDLVQETFLRAWKALDSLKDVGAAKSWLITILRREYARTFERKVPPLSDIDGVSVAEEDELAPDERAERDLLRQAMLELELKYREPLVLQVVFGLSIGEIAAQLELTDSAVMTRVFRAREKLKERLQPQDRKGGNIHELT